MKRKIRKNFQQLIIQNRLEIKNSSYEMDRIERKIEEKHLKDTFDSQSN
ncbi:FbpB family small basic protein [Bacillus sp. DNRA2]|nr:FbpB family small basic protein [Bacillus sp. DNRA2]NMD71819.1 FbpB family small basic protein [Bacillus sp. DNRA2]